jgi:hypothetical protein
MSTEAATKVRRTLQLRFTLPAANSEQMAAMIKAAAPFYQMFGNAQVRLLQNVDDPTKFIQEIEYEAQEEWELNRQRIAGDVRMQTYLQAWRTRLPGAPVALQFSTARRSGHQSGSSSARCPCPRPG